MINFFRKKRKSLADDNKALKYTRYAIGEIFLVVIGILIALQINNWNEHRKDQTKEKATLNKFLQDLKSDSIYYQVNLRRVLSIDSLHKEIYLVGFKGKETIEHDKPNYIRRSLVYNPVARENDPNITIKINNSEIREEIQVYFRNMSAVYDSNYEHERVIFKIREFLRKNRIHKVQAWFDSEMLVTLESEVPEFIINRSDLVMLSKNEDFQQLLIESSIKLNEIKQTLTELIEDNTRLMMEVNNYIKEYD